MQNQALPSAVSLLPLPPAAATCRCPHPFARPGPPQQRNYELAGVCG